MATFAPEATKRSAIARPNPCAPPVTTAQRPFRSILFIALFLYSKRPASKRPAAVDDMGDAGSERALVAGEVDGKGSYFLRRAEPSHRLAAHEHFAPLRTRRGGAVKHRRGLDGPWTDTVAANALCYEINGNRPGQRRDRGLGCAVDVTIGRGLEHAGGGGDVHDRAAAGFQHARQERPERPVHRFDVKVEREIPILV